MNDCYPKSILNKITMDLNTDDMFEDVFGDPFKQPPPVKEEEKVEEQKEQNEPNEQNEQKEVPSSTEEKDEKQEEIEDEPIKENNQQNDSNDSDDQNQDSPRGNHAPIDFEGEDEIYDKEEEANIKPLEDSKEEIEENQEEKKESLPPVQKPELMNSSKFDLSNHTVEKSKNIIEYKVIIIGSSAVGKTSILSRYIDKQFSRDHKSTLGCISKVKTIDLNSQTAIKMNLWDTSGDERYKSVMKSFYQGADAVILVYDITNEASFDDLSFWMEDLENTCKKGYITHLVGNKTDLENIRVISTEKGKNFAKDKGFSFSEVSAKNGNNINFLFETLAESLSNKVEQEEKNEETKEKKEKKMKLINLNIDNKENTKDNNNGTSSQSKKKKGGCC